MVCAMPEASRETPNSAAATRTDLPRQTSTTTPRVRVTRPSPSTDFHRWRKTDGFSIDFDMLFPFVLSSKVPFRRRVWLWYFDAAVLEFFAAEAFPRLFQLALGGGQAVPVLPRAQPRDRP